MTNWKIPEFTLTELRSVYTIDLQEVNNPLRKDVNPEPEIEYNYTEDDRHIFEFFYKVFLFTWKRILVTDRLEYILYGKKQLFSNDAYGKVVSRKYMFINAIYRRCSLATYLIPREEDLFRKWGASEIQLTAAEAGRIVWRKFDYRIIHSDFLRLKTHYESWCKERGLSADSINSDLQFPEDFLMEIKTFKMYKKL